MWSSWTGWTRGGRFDSGPFGFCAGVHVRVDTRNRNAGPCNLGWIPGPVAVCGGEEASEVPSWRRSSGPMSWMGREPLGPTRTAGDTAANPQGSGPRGSGVLTSARPFWAALLLPPKAVGRRGALRENPRRC